MGRMATRHRTLRRPLLSRGRLGATSPNVCYVMLADRLVGEGAVKSHRNGVENGCHLRTSAPLGSPPRLFKPVSQTLDGDENRFDPCRLDAHLAS